MNNNKLKEITELFIIDSLTKGEALDNKLYKKGQPKLENHIYGFINPTIEFTENFATDSIKMQKFSDFLFNLLHTAETDAAESSLYNQESVAVDSHALEEILNLQTLQGILLMLLDAYGLEYKDFSFFSDREEMVKDILKSNNVTNLLLYSYHFPKKVHTRGLLRVIPINNFIMDMMTGVYSATISYEEDLLPF